MKTRYYSCVNCGHHGDYGKERQRGLTCQKCDYEDITPLDSEEWSDYHKERKKIKDWFDGKLDTWES